MKIVKKINFFVFLYLLSTCSFGQLIIASKTLVCPNEPTVLKINDNALQEDKFCVTKIGERFGLHYFKTCKQVTVEEAILMAKIMNGFLATANDDSKNDYLFNRLPNDIHWIGYFQNPKSKSFKDPPDPNSGFEWMSKQPLSKPYWVEGEPNNYEDVSPGRYVIQGCRRDPRWCDENGEKKYVGLIESKSADIPIINAPRILWETGETTQSITVRPPKSRYYSVTIFYNTRSITDSILIETPEINAQFSKPGGCNPYKWKPELITNATLNSLDISWTFGDSIKNGMLKPEFLSKSNGFITGKVKVTSKECGFVLLEKTERFELYPMKSQELISKEVRLNQEVQIKPYNEGPFTYSWTQEKGLSDSKAFSPIFNAEENIIYKVKILDDFGCSVTEEFEFTIDPDLLIFVPEIFTPNGDGKNDFFEFKLIDGFYGKVHALEIYNKWGELIFKSVLDNFKWDGYFSGKPLPVDQYSYKISYEILNKKYNKMGNVFLLR
jgi:gliding motility-associated-like protein